jgi:3-oxoacyl-[acyl-carrier protein] reductase
MTATALPFRHGSYVVTGAASGIGAAAASVLAGCGLPLLLVDRDATGLASVADSVSAAGAPVTTTVTDFGEASEIAALGEVVAGLDPAPAGVAHFAGIFQRALAHELEPADWERLVSVNLTGSFLLARAVLPSLMAAGGGSMVLTSSMTGRTSSVGVAANYIASKAGVIGLTMSLARQYAPHGIRVNCLAPGKVDTPLFRAELPAEIADDPGFDVPLGRVAAPEELGWCAAFLLSEAASFVTGETLNVNGGQLMV